MITQSSSFGELYAKLAVNTAIAPSLGNVIEMVVVRSTPVLAVNIMYVLRFALLIGRMMVQRQQHW